MKTNIIVVIIVFLLGLILAMTGYNGCETGCPGGECEILPDDYALNMSLTGIGILIIIISLVLFNWADTTNKRVNRLEKINKDNKEKKQK